jgi:cytochrome c-type biogenesis protein CcmF
MVHESAPVALANLVAKNNRRYGGYIIHIGVIAAFVGIVGSAFFKTEVKTSVHDGESFMVGPYTMRYLGLTGTDTPHLESASARLEVLRNGREVTIMEPAKLFYKREQQPATQVAIRTTPYADLYVVLAGLDDKGQIATFEVFLTPLVFWLWAGGLLMAFGTVVVMWPNVRERAAIAVALRGARTEELAGEPAPGGD